MKSGVKTGGRITEVPHPRIARRWASVRAETHRRRLIAAGSVLAAASAVAVAVWMVQGPLLRVREIEVMGADRVSEAELIEVTGVERGDSMFTLDTDSVVERVLGLVWVRRARAVRSWPDTLWIVVEEREPVAVLEKRGAEFWLADREGVVLSEITSPSERWVRVRTTESVDPRPGRRLTGPALDAFRLVDQMADRLKKEVASVEVDSQTGEMTLGLRDSARIALGDTRRMDEKLRSAMTVLARVDRRCITLIDVRAPRTPTVTRSTSCVRDVIGEDGPAAEHPATEDPLDRA